MGEILLCSHSSPLGEILLYSSFSGGKFYYGGKNYSTTPARYHARQIPGQVTGKDMGPATDTVTRNLRCNLHRHMCNTPAPYKQAPPFGTKEEGVPSVTE